MKKNMGSADRIIRGIVGVALGYLVLVGAVDGVLAVVLGVVALVFLVTAAVGACPAYGPLGINTCCKGGGGKSCCGG
jgi:hypothetical protein